MMVLSDAQIDFLNTMIDGKWEIDIEKGLIDVTGSIQVSGKLQDGRLPVRFGVVTGDFSCVDVDLVTLEGCPYWVGCDFNCAINNLTTLKYAPENIIKNFYFRYNPLQRLDWIPIRIGKVYLSLECIHVDYYDTIIPEIEELIEKGVKIIRPDTCYYTYKEDYYERKMIELL